MKSKNMIIATMLIAIFCVPLGSAKPLDPVLMVVPECPAVPVATGGSPNGSTWEIYIGPTQPEESNVFEMPKDTPPLTLWSVWASWNLGAATLNNGADGYVFGVTADWGNGNAARVVDGALAQAGCMEVGSFYNDLAPSLFSYTVEGGTYGQSGGTECSWEISIEVMVGVSFSVTGPEGTAEVTLGGSYGCSASTTFDSEVIFGTTGSVPI